MNWIIFVQWWTTSLLPLSRPQIICTIQNCTTTILSISPDSFSNFYLQNVTNRWREDIFLEKLKIFSEGLHVPQFIDYDIILK
jgi:hypothetical protein